MKKFWELKIETSFFSNFYSNFIWLISNVKYTLEIFI